MTAFDLVLRGGRVVDPEGIRAVDLAVADGRVAALLPPGEAVEAAVVYDARDKVLLPGLVDAHVHLREPGLTWKEDFSSGTRAAIAGGVTTVLVMPTDDPWTSTPATFRAKRNLAGGRLHCDAALQVAVSRDLDGLEALVELGASSFEIFTADVPDAFLHDTSAALRDAVAAVHAAGGLSAVSPGDQSILESELALLSPGRSSVADFGRTRPSHAEAQGIARAMLVAAEVGAPIHIRQCNSQEGMAVYRQLRDRADVSIETSPQCLIFTADDYDRLGPEAKASPPWRAAADRDAVRAAVANGTIDMIVTDHAPHRRDEKMAHTGDFAAVPGGFPGVQTLLATLLALVDDGLIDLTDLVRLAAMRPASRFGLGSRKGRLRPGFDADILVVDPARPSAVRREDQRSKSTFTPFEGLTVSASLERVFLCGRAVDGSGTATGRVLGVKR